MANKRTENPAPATLYKREWLEKNRGRQNAYMRSWHSERRTRVTSHYGGKCACCGEDEPRFLAIDHMKGGGEQHRKEVGGGSHMISWLINNNFPSDFRVLCHNCNMAIGFYGRCPHEERKALYAVA